MADVQAPPPKVEVQDPLPETDWFWRRIFTFALCTVIAIGVWIMVQTMVNVATNEPKLVVGAFLNVIKWLLLIGWFAQLYYMIAPSAEQIVKILQTANIFKSGGVLSTTQTAIAADGSTATATTTVAPAPIAPSLVAGADGPENANKLLVNDPLGYQGPEIVPAPVTPSGKTEAPWQR